MNNIQWYPGHMAKANKEILNQIGVVDIVIEIRDARIPLASTNPNFNDEKFLKKPHLIILNKADLADKEENNKWLNYLNKENTLFVNSTSDNLSKIVVNKCKEILKEKLEKAKAKGIKKKVIKAMVIGIPNVGKSTFINNIVNKKAQKVENRPGVTKNVSWININDDLLLLDTPGVLWPKFSDQKQAMWLSIVGSINDDILDKEELTRFAVEEINKLYPNVLKDRYSINDSEDLLREIGLNKKCLKKNGEVDYLKTSELILNDIRNNKLGNLTYEKISA